MKKKFCRMHHLQMVIVFALFVPGMALAQIRTVSGTVTQNQKPLSNVSVSQEGSNITAVTNSSGKYQIQVSGENPVLIFRHSDYREIKKAIDKESTFNLDMQEKVEAIKEIVLNAGYYKVKDKESTGSIAKITAKEIENQPVTNVLSAVQGRMAGVSIVQNSGVAGGGFDVQIRGRNSLRTILNGSNDGNQPLYIIDGIPWTSQLTSTYSTGILPLRNINPLNSISPNDIENIEILKDADATAIYGSRGGNGVILVTTKRGRKAGIRLSINSSYTLSKVINHLEMMNTEQYLKMRTEAYTNSGGQIPANAYDINGIWNQNRYTNWQKVLIGNMADSFNTQISISGGNNNNSFLLSASHGDQTTVFPGDFHYKTNFINSNYNYSSIDRKFSINFSNLFSNLSNNIISNDFTNRSINLSPNAPALYDSFGSVNWENNTFSNPIAALNGTYSNKITQINQNINTSYSLSDRWSVKINGGVKYQEMEEFSLAPNTMNNPAFPAGASSARSSSSRGTSTMFSYILEPQIAWNKSVGNHTWNSMVGLTIQNSVSKSSAMSGTGYASNALLHNIAGATTITFQPFNTIQYRYAAIFGRLNYKYKERYIVNVTARRDGSSRFGPNNRFANFGALGAAWIFSEENFLKDISWLSFGKLRGSYGITGSDMIGDYQYTNTYTLSSSSYNDVPALFPSRLFNPDFTWEKTKKLETGIELGFFKNKLRVTSAYYQNTSSNQLVGIPLPTITGFSSVQANLDAVVQNSGMEFEIFANPLTRKNWKWNINFNISLPKNKLVSFPGLEGSTYANTYVIGEPTTIVKLLQYEGINPVTGEYTFTDFNSDGKISSPEDAKAIQNLGVKFFGGLHNDIQFGNFRVSLLFQFVKQNNWNYFRTMNTPGNMNNQPAEFANVWSATNPQGIIMPYSPGTVPNVNTLTTNFKNSTAAVGDASFIRLKNVQVNYKLPIRGTLLSDAEIYFQGQNLVTWTNYFGIDPEFLVTGFLPPLKTYSLGFRITF